MEAFNPKIGVPGILKDGEIWKQAPQVTLRIDGVIGEIVEERIEEGSKPMIKRQTFTTPSEEDEEAVLDATRF